MRKRRFRLSEQAADDLTDIYDYIAKTKPKAAQRVVDAIQAKIRSIAALALPGTPKDDMKPDLRAAVFRNHMIYFHVTTSHLLILRILHGRQDITSENFPESEI
ncbi:type II toxin-antitoxin system RelE/ParE family toxin [Pararhizobium sp. PWRC1-1]|uniref:type II toxin-antitoxin system RelE/ParE family toxin n=1 Tax=Pararhizobium sp. PWRC1-1 TaxID=2804566 RepID=UPI003CF83492